MLYVSPLATKWTVKGTRALQKAARQTYRGGEGRKGEDTPPRNACLSPENVANDLDSLPLPRSPAVDCSGLFTLRRVGTTGGPDGGVEFSGTRREGRRRSLVFFFVLSLASDTSRQNTYQLFYWSITKPGEYTFIRSKYILFVHCCPVERRCISTFLFLFCALDMFPFVGRGGDDGFVK